MTDLIKNQKSEKICVLRDPCLPPGSAVNWNHGFEHGTDLCVSSQVQDSVATCCACPDRTQAGGEAL